MGVDYPLLYDPHRLEQLRIFTDAGRPVSLVGTILSDVTLLGCQTRIASVGSVCTDPRARGHGLAGQLVDDAVQRAAEAGASLMLISGHRTLYARRGGVEAGLFRRYHVFVRDLTSPTDGLTLRTVTPETCDQALRLFEAEPARFRRDLADYAKQIACERVMNRPGHTWLVERQGRPMALFSADHPRAGDGGGPATIQIRELAGCRLSLIRALPLAARELGADAFAIDAYEFDRSLEEALKDIVRWDSMPHTGVVKLLDPARLWRDFKPLIAERIGAEALGRISVRSESDDLRVHALTFEMGGEILTFDSPEDLTAALLGHPNHKPLINARGSLADILHKALPLPLPMYGLNYV
jgi:GNAT superfamily N-acetyltransferase